MGESKVKNEKHAFEKGFLFDVFFDIIRKTKMGTPKEERLQYEKNMEKPAIPIAPWSGSRYFGRSGCIDASIRNHRGTGDECGCYI